MSSQGLNSTAYSGVTVSVTPTPGQYGTPGLYPMRDAQDFTLLTKRIGVQRSAGFGSVRPSPDVGDVQSNSALLSLEFAAAQCNGCAPVNIYPG